MAKRSCVVTWYIDGNSKKRQRYIKTNLLGGLSDEEKQELLVSPLKRTLKSAGIEMAEADGDDNFVLKVKSTSW